jgi:hypothetical protein
MSQTTARPASIRVLATLNLVFAGLGVVGLFMTYAMYFGGLELGPRNPVIEIARESPEYMTFLKWSFLIGGVRCLMLAGAGFGLLRYRPWARTLNIATALFGIISGIAGMMATHHYLIEPLSKSDDPAAKAGAFGGYAAILGIVYPVVVLIFMLKKDVREALDRGSDPPIPSARVR